MRLFGTNGVRGKIGEEFRPDFLVKLGMAIGSYLPKGSKVVLGSDTRISGDMVKSAVISGILSTGVEVFDIGIAPTPSIQLYTKNHGDFGIAITASHNPPEFNGVKAIGGDGTELPREEEEKIEDIFFRGDFRIVNWSEVRTVHRGTGANDEYLQRIKSLVDLEAIRSSGLSVALDCGNGAASLTSPYLLEDLGVKVVSLNCQPDGRFPGRESEPKPENLGDLISIVPEGEFDLGVAHDGDADRVVFVDERGRFVSGDKSMAIVASHILEEGDILVTPVSTSLIVEEMARKRGAKVVYTKVGAPIVARKMIELNARFGGEENGGLIFPEMQYCRDGAMGMAKMLEIIAKTSSTMGELVDSLPRYHQRKISVPCENEKKGKVLEVLKENHSGEDIVTIDGVKVRGDDWWILIRPSGTEPIYRIYGEAKSEEHLNEILEKYRRELEEIISSL